MIELILLLAAVLSANEVVGDSPQSPDVADHSAVISRSQTDPQSPSRQEDGRLLRLAADVIPGDADPDLEATAKLVDEFDDEKSPASARGLNFVRADITYPSQGQQIRMEVLRPDTDARRPAVLILHGASGIGDGAFYRNAAEIFAERGYVTFLPHYLAATPAPAPKKGKAAAKTAKATGNGSGSIRAEFSQQDRILRDALETIANNPYVDGARIGVFGMSLGGFHALNLSANDYRIAAVVNMAGALRGNNMPESNRVAPTLALHGAKDAIVPVGRAKSLGNYLQSRSIPHDVVIYPDQGHFFRGKARHDAFQRSVSFFNAYLMPVEPNSATARRPY